MLNPFVQIEKCICQHFKMYLSSLKNKGTWYPQVEKGGLSPSELVSSLVKLIASNNAAVKGEVLLTLISIPLSVFLFQYPSSDFPHRYSLIGIPSWVPPHRYSLVCLPSSVFHCQYSLICIPSFVFLHLYSLIRIPSSVFPCLYYLVRIPLSVFPHL